MMINARFLSLWAARRKALDWCWRSATEMDHEVTAEQ
jgi:hypothetical protein